MFRGKEQVEAGKEKCSGIRRRDIWGKWAAACFERNLPAANGPGIHYHLDLFPGQAFVLGAIENQRVLRLIRKWFRTSSLMTETGRLTCLIFRNISTTSKLRGLKF